MKKYFHLALVALLITCCTPMAAQQKALSQLQQEFVDLRFGMFLHFNIPTFMTDDWADPDADPSIFDPKKLDCSQWAKTAKEANMTYGCLTTKHHSGFCIWDTKTTDYNVMNSPCKRDVVKEYADAFRAQGLNVMLYYSILDTHHKIRPGYITQSHVEMIKNQLTELLTNYGDVQALIIDGWDAPWSRISYDEIPFEDIYYHIKSIQPNCLIMDLNAAKYPTDVLYYTDIKSYEQGAGQHIPKETNRLPAMSCLPLNENWFWKDHFPTSPVKDAAEMVNNNIIPFNKVHCNFLLNAAPNRDGLIDANAVEALRKIRKMWKHEGPLTKIGQVEAPVISSNIAKFKPATSSWSWDMNLMDFANDDNFRTYWVSNKNVKKPWLQIDLGNEQAFNMITIAEGAGKNDIERYTVEYLQNNVWKTLYSGTNKDIIKLHRFQRVWGNKVRISIDGFKSNPTISEFGIYNERN